jgi:hypothetical protein
MCGALFVGLCLLLVSLAPVSAQAQADPSEVCSAASLFASWRDAAPTLGQFGGDRGHCFFACKSWHQTCIALANMAGQCELHVSNGDFRIGIAECNSLDDKDDRRDCSRGNVDDARDNRSDAHDTRGEFRQSCKNVLAERCGCED